MIRRLLTLTITTTLIGACGWLWPLEGEFDPHRCEPACQGNQRCNNGQCVDPGAAGALDRGIALEDGPKKKDVKVVKKDKGKPKLDKPRPKLDKPKVPLPDKYVPPVPDKYVPPVPDKYVPPVPDKAIKKDTGGSPPWQPGFGAVFDGPKVASDGPKLKPDGPKMKPDGPQLKPDGPKLKPDGPKLKPDMKKPKPDMTRPKPDMPQPKPLACAAQGGTAPVKKPVLVKNIPWTGTSWFGGAAIVDLDGDGKKELVGAFYDLYVWDAKGTQIAKAKSYGHHDSRIYAPAVIADLDGDKVTEIVVGGKKKVAAYQCKAKKLSIKAGWPVQPGTSSVYYEVRGLAAGDLDGDGVLEVALQSFDHGLDLYRVPGSGTKCLLWPVARGNLLRNGQGPQYK